MNQLALWPDLTVQINLLRPRPNGACEVQGCGSPPVCAVETKGGAVRIPVCEFHAAGFEGMGWVRTVRRD